MANGVLLAKGLGKNGQVVEIRGDYFTKTRITGVADSIQAVQEAGLVQVPSYLIGEGRIAAGRDAEAKGDIKLVLEEPVWNQWHDTFAETDTIVDKKGILGEKEDYMLPVSKTADFSSTTMKGLEILFKEKTAAN